MAARVGAMLMMKVIEFQWPHRTFRPGFPRPCLTRDFSLAVLDRTFWAFLSSLFVLVVVPYVLSPSSDGIGFSDSDLKRANSTPYNNESLGYSLLSLLLSTQDTYIVASSLHTSNSDL